MSLNLWTLRRPILVVRMRKLLVLGALALVFAAPATSQADRQPPGDHQPAGDGCLVVTNGNGTITILAQGGLVGRVDQGQVTVDDPNPTDVTSPKVFGADFSTDLGKNKTTYSGSNNLRFRFTGGGPFRVVVTGIGIDLSAIGHGRALLNGAHYIQTGGSYSADADSLCSSNVKSFPESPTKVVVGTPGTG